MFKFLILAFYLSGCNLTESAKYRVTDLIEYKAADNIESDVIKDEMVGNITLDLKTAGAKGSISREFYGTQLSPFTPYPSTDAVQKLNLGTIRIGGNLYDTYNWENGLTFLARGTYKKLESYEEAINKVREYGAEPIMQINLLGQMPVYTNGRIGMSNAATAQSAAEFIAHVNGELKLNLKHVCLGNEFDQWADTHADIWPFNDALSADDYINRYIEYAVAVRDAQEKISGNANDIKLWGPEIANSYADWQSGNMKRDCEWTSIRGVMKCSYGNGAFDHFLPYFYHRLKNAENDTSINPKGHKLLDYASFHYYPTFRTKVSDPNSIIVDRAGRQMVNEMLESTQLFHASDYVNIHDRGSYMNFKPNLFNRMRAWKNEYYPEAKLVLSEFAVDSLDTTPNYHPIVRPLYMADMIGIAANNGIDNFNRSFLNTYRPRPIPWALLLDNAPTNLGNMYNLFTEYFLGKLLVVEDTFHDKVNSYATVGDTSIALFVVNKSANDRMAKINVNDGATNLTTFNYTLKPWGMTVFRIPKEKPGADNIKIIEYGAKEMGIAVDSHYQ
ncbi:MAG: hypothetical protein A2X86_13895 [Bdellovibrionales bacterium GWA2_49_15]|nr:MAG: hypothetical protein A2X86_13895 [Bdellovibrionales bacterium GWA2_49_15]HAZ13621.1 hypothetical protein [Bdellovibrionales bacterium]